MPSPLAKHAAMGSINIVSYDHEYYKYHEAAASYRPHATVLWPHATLPADCAVLLTIRVTLSVSLLVKPFY